MKDLIRMNRLAGIITEGQARKMMAILNEEATIPNDKIEAYILQFAADDTFERQERGNAYPPGFGDKQIAMEKEHPGIKMVAYNYCKSSKGTDIKVNSACKESFLSSVNANMFKA